LRHSRTTLLLCLPTLLHATRPGFQETARYAPATAPWILQNPFKHSVRIAMEPGSGGIFHLLHPSMPGRVEIVGQTWVPDYLLFPLELVVVFLPEPDARTFRLTDSAGQVLRRSLVHFPDLPDDLKVPGVLGMPLYRNGPQLPQALEWALDPGGDGKPSSQIAVSS
jgi:hypothetical protein